MGDENKKGKTASIALDEALEHGDVDLNSLASLVWDGMEDQERQYAAVSGIVQRLRSAARAKLFSLRNFRMSWPFNLPYASSVSHGEARLKLTENLSRDEFRRAIEIRRKQIEEDQKSLREWEAADRLAAPFWRGHAEWTFGECMMALAREIRAKASDPDDKTE